MLSARVALGLGLAATLAALVIVLSSSPPAILATNGVEEAGSLNPTDGKPVRICQAGERLPAGTNTIQASIEDFTGPRMQLQVFHDGRIITSGVLGAGWSGRAVPIGVAAVRRTVAPVEVCLSSTNTSEGIGMSGSESSAASEARSSAGTPVGGRMRIVYLGPGHTSWLSRVASVARNMEFGRAWSGPWVAPFLLALMLACVAVVSMLVLRGRDD
jgi:hypothetical protein